MIKKTNPIKKQRGAILESNVSPGDNTPIRGIATEITPRIINKTPVATLLFFMSDTPKLNFIEDPSIDPLKKYWSKRRYLTLLFEFIVLGKL